MKHLYDFNIFQRMILRLIWAIEKKIYGRPWTYNEQVYRALILIQEDQQWMAHDDLAYQLSRRHLELLKDTWHSTAHISVSEFRREQGLCPHTSSPITKVTITKPIHVNRDSIAD